MSSSSTYFSEAELPSSSGGSLAAIAVDSCTPVCDEYWDDEVVYRPVPQLHRRGRSSYVASWPRRLEQVRRGQLQVTVMPSWAQSTPVNSEEPSSHSLDAVAVSDSRPTDVRTEPHLSTGGSPAQRPSLGTGTRAEGADGGGDVVSASNATERGIMAQHWCIIPRTGYLESVLRSVPVRDKSARVERQEWVSADSHDHMLEGHAAEADRTVPGGDATTSAMLVDVVSDGDAVATGGGKPTTRVEQQPTGISAGGDAVTMAGVETFAEPRHAFVDCAAGCAVMNCVARSTGCSDAKEKGGVVTPSPAAEICGDRAVCAMAPGPPALSAEACSAAVRCATDRPQSTPHDTS